MSMRAAGSLSGSRVAAFLVAACLVFSFKGAACAGNTDSADLVTGPAWDRPALATSFPERAVLLSAAKAGNRLLAVGERGILLLSDDHGTHWVQSPVPTSVTLTAVQFANAENGFAVGHAGTVLSTTDGGRTWTRRLDGRRIAEIELIAARASADAAAIKSAERLVADGPDKPLLDLYVFDQHRVIVVGAYGIALETKDGGKSWSSWRARLDNKKENHIYTVRRRGERIILAGEQGLLLQSLDGGVTFERVKAAYMGSWFTSELPDDDGIVVAGLRGNIWRSRDRGGSWEQIASPVPASVIASALRPDGSVLVASQAGLVMRLPAANGPAHALAGVQLAPLNGLLPLPDGSILALTMQGLHLLPSTAASKEELR